MTTQEEAKQALARLTYRQRQVAIMKARGMTANEIAEAQSRTPETVRSHLYAAFKNLGIKNSSQLAVICALAGEVKDWRGCHDH